MGAVPQQRVRNAWQARRFLFQETPTHQIYSEYYYERLAIYEVAKHFRHMLEAHHFIIFTDHKPISPTPSSRNGTNDNRGNSVMSTS
jgi:hypothetical protein